MRGHEWQLRSEFSGLKDILPTNLATNRGLRNAASSQSLHPVRSIRICLDTGFPPLFAMDFVQDTDSVFSVFHPVGTVASKKLGAIPSADQGQ